MLRRRGTKNNELALVLVATENAIVDVGEIEAGDCAGEGREQDDI